MLGRHPIHFLGECTHEGHLAARDDIGPEAVGPQVLQKFEHRLEDHLGVRLVRARVHSRRQPALGVGSECLGADAGMGGGHNFQHAVHAAVTQCLLVAFQDCLERLLAGPFRVLRCEPSDLIEGKQHFEIQGLLTP
ncbi:hypothetical protein D3C81_1420140 [compost metagenome]